MSLGRSEARTPTRSTPSMEATDVIVRIWHGVTEAARADSYLEYLEKTGLADYARTPGNRGVLVLRLDNDDTTSTMTIQLIG